MYTIIELFDECQLENIASFLKFNPQKIIYIGFSDEEYEEKFEALSQVLKRHNPEIILEYVVVRHDDYLDISQKLEDIVASNENCCFELTGGNELLLVAMGALSTKHNVPMYQISPETGTINIIHGGELLPPEENVPLTLTDSITLNSGIMESFEAPLLTQEYTETLQELWEIARDGNRFWNSQVGQFIIFEKQFCHEISPLKYECEATHFNDKKKPFATLFHELRKQGCIESHFNGTKFIYQYKNPYVKPLLEKGGNVLEAYTYSLISQLKEHTDYDIHDLTMQTMVRWLEDGEASSVLNEIDVAFMHGIVPVFVSCKSGAVDKTALYELNTIGERLGGKYAKKILIVTELSGTELSKKIFLDRARELDIFVISDICFMYDERVMRRIKMALGLL